MFVVLLSITNVSAGNYKPSSGSWNGNKTEYVEIKNVNIVIVHYSVRMKDFAIATFILTYFVLLSFQKPEEGLKFSPEKSLLNIRIYKQLDFLGIPLTLIFVEGLPLYTYFSSLTIFQYIVHHSCKRVKI